MSEPLLDRAGRSRSPKRIDGLIEAAKACREMAERVGARPWPRLPVNGREILAPLSLSLR